MNLTAKQEGVLADTLSPHFLGREQQALVSLGDKVVDIAKDSFTDEISGLQAQLDDISSFEGASLVGIEDVAGNFSATDVEGALAELVVMGAPFDPSDDYTVTGSWEFTQPLVVGTLDAAMLEADAVAAVAVGTEALALVDGANVGELSFSLTAGRTYTLQDASGTLAFTSDIPAQVNLAAGSNVNITGTYPNLTISASGGGGGGGDVASVNGQTGDVILTASDVGAAATSHTHSAATTSVAGFMSAADKTKLNGIAAGATASSGTVTSVNVTGGTGISFTGGPITTSGAITATLNANLQGWSAVSTASKANANAVVTTTGNQTGLAGNKTWTGAHTFASVSDSSGDLRRARARVVTTSGNFSAIDLNSVVEKDSTASLTWTLAAGFGSHGDIITVSNQGASGTITIARASGVSLYRNGTNANIVVQPGNVVTITKCNASNRWAA